MRLYLAAVFGLQFSELQSLAFRHPTWRLYSYDLFGYEERIAAQCIHLRTLLEDIFLVNKKVIQTAVFFYRTHPFGISGNMHLEGTRECVYSEELSGCIGILIGAALKMSEEGRAASFWRPGSIQSPTITKHHKSPASLTNR